MELSEALKEHFGYDTFRKGQEAVVRSVLSGRPTIAILPTGGGKSLCYQLPALLLEGTTIVVSPLLALMKDQVDALRARGIEATFVNSSLSDGERQERQAALRRGEYRLVYVAPERFRSPSFLSAMTGIKVPLLAIDEAHCISAWGHDFRPEYQKIAQAREALGAERVLALTATATPEVRRDIAEALDLREPNVFVAGFDRPNLFIEVLRVGGVGKADIRFVAHFDVPRSLEAYYQEIGRAGRDGSESYALLLFHFADVMMQRRMIEAGRPSRELVERAWEAARKLEHGSLAELARACGVAVTELGGAVRLLESAGHLDRGRSREALFAVATGSVAAADLTVDFELLEMRVARERQMLDRLVRFADTRGCRRQNLLRYFGDAEVPRGCKACESCAGSRAPEPEEVAARPKKQRAVAAEPQPEGPYDEEVFAKLRTLRTELARELRMPPYVVFHDSTLRALARELPHDEHSFLAVKGAGPNRWQRYGARVVVITGAARQSEVMPAAVEAETAPMVREPPAWLEQLPLPINDSADELWTLCA